MNDMGQRPKPATHSLMTFFQYEHLKDPYIKDLTKLFHALANQLDKSLAVGAEKTVCMRKLLESKDCAVRAHWL